MTVDTLPPEKLADFEYCEEIIRRHSLSFYTAFSALPAQKARSVYAIYAFCRLADDCIDERQNLAELQQLERELERFFEGHTPDTPVWRALRVVFNSFDMDPWAFRAMIDGQKKDYTFSQPQTQNDLEAYCYLVAGSVGLMLLPVLSSLHRTWRQQAVHLGVAMQLTNILRDVGEDYQRGRVYFPAECMEKYGYTMEDLASQTVDKRFKALWEHQAKRAEELYLSFEKAIPLLDDDSVVPVLSASRLYGGILQAVRGNEYNCFTKRAIVSPGLREELLSDVVHSGGASA